MRKRSRKKHVQLTIESAIKETGRGGPRRGSGRPKGRKTVSHDKREPFAARYPLHVTLRILPGVESLAREHVMKILRKAIRAAHKPDFRIVEFNVLTNHLHLVVEAHDPVALARGMQGFEVRVARRVNRAFGREGRLFAHRYHARVLRTPREVRNVLRYVLLNRKHHAAEKKFSSQWIDPCSSAAWFSGWASAIRADMYWKRELVEMQAPNAKPTVWLLTTGWWAKHGRLRFDEASS